MCPDEAGDVSFIANMVKHHCHSYEEVEIALHEQIDMILHLQIFDSSHVYHLRRHLAETIELLLAARFRNAPPPPVSIVEDKHIDDGYVQADTIVGNAGVATTVPAAADSDLSFEGDDGQELHVAAATALAPAAPPAAATTSPPALPPPAPPEQPEKPAQPEPAPPHLRHRRPSRRRHPPPHRPQCRYHPPPPLPPEPPPPPPQRHRPPPFRHRPPPPPPLPPEPRPYGRRTLIHKHDYAQSLVAPSTIIP